jgi:catechol 2,3-dioxygenase-like lactoylglutathione lyase family enzyme
MPTAVSAGTYLHHLALCSHDPATLARFYADAMDMQVRRVGSGNWYCEGPMRRIMLIEGLDKTLAYAGFACRDDKGLAGIRARAVGAGLELLACPSALFGDEAFGVRDPDGNLILFGRATPTVPGKAVRAPLQHLTLASQNPEALERFYVDALGFCTSDYARGAGETTAAIWMRSNHEHHTLACFRRKSPGIDHFSFEAGDWATIKTWCDRMGERRIPIIWGPGRHGPGNNLFIFIRDSDSNWIEISAELEVIYDRPPVIWPAEPYTLNKWGTAILRD